MSGATFIIAINLAVAGLLSAAFRAIASYEPTRSAGYWLASAYLIGMIYYVVEFGIRLFDGGALMVSFGAAVLLAGMLAFNMGLATRYRVRAPLSLLACVVVIGALLTILVDGLPRHSLTRMMGFQVPYFIMQALGVSIVWRAANKNRLDLLFAGLLGLSALQFLSKPFIAYAVGGWGANPGVYLGSNYAMVSQSLGTVFAFALALTAMVILTRDILSDATEKSETDTLSGLNNRRGFEMHARLELERARDSGLPLTMVICDLDHFKSINDSYGHASGDRVISAFAHFLRASVLGRHVAGRIGGEEFAVMLPGANLATARLFAEGARSAFSGMPIEGLPDDRRFTASFGVAELETGETLEGLMQRADKALYLAKQTGRDCVRLAASDYLGAVAHGGGQQHGTVVPSGDPQPERFGTAGF